MKKSVCLSQDSNLGSLIYLYGLIQPIRGMNRVKLKSFQIFASISVNASWSSGYVSGNWIRDPKFESWLRQTFFSLFLLFFT